MTLAYIVLLISDWGGDCRSVRGKLFASLREHDYNKETFEVRFKHSRIVLNVRDAVNSEDWLELGDPRRLFRCYKKELQTAALYFQDEELNEIGPHEIGKVNGISTRKKKCIKYICSVGLKLGDGMPIYRVIRRHDIPIKLVNVETADRSGENEVGSWRLARTGERGLSL